jgi:nicotinate-nucleotide adenylyltransferase
MRDVALTTLNRLGIMGGTFDPIHYGHLTIAEEARRHFALDAVLFIPAGAPPHKPRWRTDAEQRYLMAVLATADHPQFFVSRMEIDRPGRSYTVDTLQALHTEYPHTALYFILGADSALEFHLWRAPQEILSLATVVAATRPGFPLEQLTALAEQIAILPTPGLEISSTALRARAQKGQILRYLTPPAVAEYIQKMGLYRNDCAEESS